MVVNLSDIKDKIFEMIFNYIETDHFETELIGDADTISSFQWSLHFNKIEITGKEITYKIASKPCDGDNNFIKNHLFIMYITINKDKMVINKISHKSPELSINSTRYIKLYNIISNMINNTFNERININIFKLCENKNIEIRW